MAGLWNKNSIEILQTMWLTSERSAQDIADELAKHGHDVTRSAVLGKIHRMGLANQIDGKKHRASMGIWRDPNDGKYQRDPTKPPKAPVIKKAPTVIKTTEAPIKSELKVMGHFSNLFRIPRPRTAEVPLRRYEGGKEPRASKQVSLMNLCNHMCKWPYGDRNYRFCGEDRFEGRPYCGWHCARAYQTRVHKGEKDGSSERIEGFEAKKAAGSGGK